MSTEIAKDVHPDRVYDTFRKKTFMITGGMGFVGKVYIEALLRVFDVEKIYVLIRAKKGMQPSERLSALFTSPVIIFLIPFNFSNTEHSFKRVGTLFSNRHSSISTMKLLFLFYFCSHQKENYYSVIISAEPACQLAYPFDSAVIVSQKVSRSFLSCHYIFKILSSKI